MCVFSCRVSLNVDSLHVYGTFNNENSKGTNILHQPSSFLGQPAAGRSAEQRATNQPVLSVEFTVSHDDTHGMPSLEGREGSLQELGIFHHNLKLHLQQTVLFIDKTTILKMASLAAHLSGGFSAE